MTAVRLLIIREEGLAYLYSRPPDCAFSATVCMRRFANLHNRAGFPLTARILPPSPLSLPFSTIRDMHRCAIPRRVAHRGRVGSRIFVLWNLMIYRSAPKYVRA